MDDVAFVQCKSVNDQRERCAENARESDGATYSYCLDHLCNGENKRGKPCRQKKRKGGNFCGPHSKQLKLGKIVKSQCISIILNGKQCSRKAKQGTDFCGIHQHVIDADLPGSSVNNVKFDSSLCSATKSNGSICGGKLCNDSIYCKRHVNIAIDEDTRCMFIKARDNKQCRIRVVLKHKYCKLHLATINRSKSKPNQKVKKTKCSGITLKGIPCSKLALDKDKYCKVHTGQNEEPVIIRKCKKPKCTFRIKDVSDYCGKHQTYGKRKQLTDDGHSVCNISNCTNTVNEFIICDEHRKRDRDSVWKRKGKVPPPIKKSNVTIESCLVLVYGVDTVIGESEKTTSCKTRKCSIKYKPFLMVNKKPSKKCPYHYIKDKNKNDAKTKKRQALREQCTIGATHTKCIHCSIEFENFKTHSGSWSIRCQEHYTSYHSYSIKSRKKRREIDEQEFLRHNFVVHREWRIKNPGATKRIQTKCNHKPATKIKNLIRKRKADGIPWELDIKYAESMCMKPCFYCGIEPHGYITNGIDRVDNYGHYTVDNVVTACTECNNIKWIHNVVDFVLILEHIGVYNECLRIDDKKCSWPELFRDVKGNSFSAYRRRAQEMIKKGKIKRFELTEKQFIMYAKQNCYICGKKPSRTHVNGIDRIDNTKGYFEENIASCCGTCNYLKKDLSYDEFLDKCVVMYTCLSKKVYAVKTISKWWSKHNA